MVIVDCCACGAGVVAVRCHRPVPHTSAAGATFTNRTLKAPWTARCDHTSVIDAAGAIYVLGGEGFTTGGYYQDVWVSTDGGARAGLRRRWSGVHWVGTQGVLWGY